MKKQKSDFERCFPFAVNALVYHWNVGANRPIQELDFFLAGASAMVHPDSAINDDLELLRMVAFQRMINGCSLLVDQAA